MTVRKFATDLYREISDDNVYNGAAALAFYMMFALFPAAIFLLSLLPYVPIASLRDAILDFLGQALPPETAHLVSGVLEKVAASGHGGLLSFGLVFTLWSASSGLYAIMQQLNVTYDVKEGRPFWKTRAVALGLTVLFVVLVLAAFALVVFGGVLQGAAASLLGWSAGLLAVFAAFRWVVILGLLLLGFATIYYFGPDVEQRFRFVSPGSVLGVALLAAGSLGFRLYVDNFSSYDRTYGSLGAVIILLLWLYLAGFVILLGSEVNALVEHYSAAGKDKGEKREPREPREPGAPRRRAA